jgi:hypothetical protein
MSWIDQETAGGSGLSREERLQLVRALVDAFPDRGSMQFVVSIGLNHSLDQLSADGPLDVVASNVVRWAEAQNCLANLVETASDQNPGNEELARFRDEVWSVRATTERTVPQSSDSQVLWNIHAARNPNFTGRDDELRGLHEALFAISDAAIGTPISICGLGGVGKSQLAVEYAHRHKDQYEVAWRLRAGARETLAADFTSLGQAIGLVPADAGHEEATRAIRRWLENGNVRWLLVFDNAGSSEAIRQYVPTSGAGHVLITSTSAIWRQIGRPFPIAGLTLKDATEFLLRRGGRAQGADEQELAAADELADEFQGLPLALEQAAAFVEETGISFVRYRQLYRERSAELLAEGRSNDEYPSTVMTTWQLAFAEVARTPGAGDLLTLGAFLAPEAIPLDVIKEYRALLPESLAMVFSDQLTVTRAIGALRRYSLIEVVDDEQISMHRLVQLVARAKLSGDQKKLWSSAAVAVIETAFPERVQDMDRWPTCNRLLAHGLSASRHARDAAVAERESANLALKMRSYLDALGKKPEGRKQMSKVRSAFRSVYGSDYDHSVDALMLESLSGFFPKKGGLE